MSRQRKLEVIQQAEDVTIGELVRLTDVRYSTLKYYTEGGDASPSSRRRKPHPAVQAGGQHPPHPADQSPPGGGEVHPPDQGPSPGGRMPPSPRTSPRRNQNPRQPDDSRLAAGVSVEARKWGWVCHRQVVPSRPPQVRTCHVGSPPGPGRGIQAFSRRKPGRKESRGRTPAPPFFMARSFPLARFGVG